jgi:hypothetical protein
MNRYIVYADTLYVRHLAKVVGENGFMLPVGYLDSSFRDLPGYSQQTSKRHK